MVIACMMHWYASAMFAVPTGAVGGWGWFSSRRIGKRAGIDAAERGETPPSPE
jgi:hypothetical protein